MVSPLVLGMHAPGQKMEISLQTGRSGFEMHIFTFHIFHGGYSIRSSKSEFGSRKTVEKHIFQQPRAE